ncbi:hypothetical protein VCB98_10085 [Gammaproteobacteria bacterium AB-CW1]|uniref:Folate-binding protein YgfZ n=1 Tax=Natronospira elongata TaxID=3110268 RepID=A0AAP6JGQ3_9GAMM|nr:hypothetical protein [Gammaproteobacteria bacterium AB-CW1]
MTESAAINDIETWAEFVRSREKADQPDSTALAWLPGLSVVRAEGGDAESFLDGQFSAAVGELGQDEAVLTAWHDPKGRAVTTVLMSRDESGFELLLPSSLMDTVLPKLRLYVLRAQVNLSAQQDTVVLGRWDDNDSGETPFRPLSGLSAAGFWSGPLSEARSLWDEFEAAGDLPIRETEWRRRELLAGLPRLGPETSGRFLPQFLGLDHFGGLSFRKGCYIGQEVIARTHYLGKVKQGLKLARCQQAAPAGAAVRDSADRLVGQVLDSVAASDASHWLVQIVVRENHDGELHLDGGGEADGEAPALKLFD